MEYSTRLVHVYREIDAGMKYRVLLENKCFHMVMKYRGFLKLNFIE